MPTSRLAVMLASTAFAAGWLYRKAFPKVVCPKCGSDTWKRISGGLKQCRDCAWKFYTHLPVAPLKK
jgi:ribosomal protein L37AE/L43A